MTIDFLRLLRLFGLVVVCLMGSTSSYAQDASDDDASDAEIEVEDSDDVEDDVEVEDLLQRLQAAEQRLSEIEGGYRNSGIFSNDDLASDPSIFGNRVQPNLRTRSDDDLASDPSVFDDRNQVKIGGLKESTGANNASTRPTVSVSAEPVGLFLGDQVFAEISEGDVDGGSSGEGSGPGLRCPCPRRPGRNGWRGTAVFRPAIPER